VLDPAEQTLPFAGRVRFSGLEGEQEELVPRVESIRAAYVERLEAHQAGLAALTREMAAEFGPHGIRVNAIAPGEIETPILSPGTRDLLGSIPLRRLGRPEEVAAVIYFLCSQPAAYVSGAEIQINGGQHV